MVKKNKKKRPAKTAVLFSRLLGGVNGVIDYTNATRRAVATLASRIGRLDAKISNGLNEVGRGHGPLLAAMREVLEQADAVIKEIQPLRSVIRAELRMEHIIDLLSRMPPLLVAEAERDSMHGVPPRIVTGKPPE